MDLSLKEIFMNYHSNMKNNKYHFDRVFDPALKLSKVDMYQVGELIVSDDYEIKTHKQICHEISYVMDGRCDFFTDGKVFHAKKGDIHIAPKGTQHKIVVKKGVTLRMAYLGFAFRESDETTSKLSLFYSTNPQQLCNDLYGCSEKFERLLKEVYVEQELALDMLDACVTEMLIYIYRYFLNRGEDKAGRIVETIRLENAVGTVIGQCIRYIDENIENMISIDEMAVAIKYNPSYLSRVFREKMNMSLHEYIDKRKVETAKRMLQEGISVTETSARLGYVRPQSLWKLFLRCEGSPPSDFLKKVDK